MVSLFLDEALVVVVQSLSCVWFFATPWTATHQASLSFTTSWSLLKLMCIESVMASNHLILCHVFLLLPQSFPASGSFPMSQLLASCGLNIRASSSVFPMNIQGWISFRTDWFNLLLVQGTLKSLLQHQSGFRGDSISSVSQSCPTLCNPMNHSIPGLHPFSPRHHQLPEFTQTHVHWVSDAIQPSHPLLSPCPPALNLSQHQGLFKWVSSSHQVAKLLEFQLQHQSFQWTLSTNLL